MRFGGRRRHCDAQVGEARTLIFRCPTWEQDEAFAPAGEMPIKRLAFTPYKPALAASIAPEPEIEQVRFLSHDTLQHLDLARL